MNSSRPYDAVVVYADVIQHVFVRRLPFWVAVYVLGALSLLGSEQYVPEMFRPVAPYFLWFAVGSYLFLFVVISGLFWLMWGLHALFEWMAVQPYPYARPEIPASVPPRPGDVYLVRGPKGIYKIGRSVNASDRRRTFEVKLPFPVSLEHVINYRNHIVAERLLHHLFANKRVSGEWFRLTRRDVAFFKSISTLGYEYFIKQDAPPASAMEKALHWLDARDRSQWGTHRAAAPLAGVSEATMRRAMKYREDNPK